VARGGGHGLTRMITEKGMVVLVRVLSAAVLDSVARGVHHEAHRDHEGFWGRVVRAGVATE